MTQVNRKLHCNDACEVRRFRMISPCQCVFGMACVPAVPNLAPLFEPYSSLKTLSTTVLRKCLLLSTVICVGPWRGWWNPHVFGTTAVQNMCGGNGRWAHHSQLAKPSGREREREREKNSPGSPRLSKTILRTLFRWSGRELPLLQWGN